MKVVNLTGFTVPVGVLALVIRHAKRMRRIISSSVASLATLYFSTLSHKRHDLQEQNIHHKMRILIFSTTFFRNISHSKRIWARYGQKRILVFMWSIRYSLSDFNETWISSTDFRKIPILSIVVKIRTLGAELFNSNRKTDGRGDMTDLIII